MTPTSAPTLSTHELDDLYGTLETRLDVFSQGRADVDTYIATRFNVFDFIQPDENRLSDILARLLDPRGVHGQGDLFLHRLLPIARKTEGLPDANLPRVQREDPTQYGQHFRRRIDITLDFGGYGIGIENKPWADEAQDQVRDYCEHLQRKYDGRFEMWYISDGTKPTTLSKSEIQRMIAQQRLRLLSYAKHILTWLDECQLQCKADRVRWFLRDFADYIRCNFQSIPVETER